jgi:hypothetical protein
VRQALIVVWEASDRICSKRLRPLLPILVEAVERHGHLQLVPEVRSRLLAMIAATIDRALCEIRRQAGDSNAPPIILPTAAFSRGQDDLRSPHMLRHDSGQPFQPPPISQPY